MIILKYLHSDDEIKSYLKNFSVISESDKKKMTKMNQFVFDHDER